MASASEALGVRGGAGNPEGDVKLADAEAARDAAQAQWQAAGG